MARGAYFDANIDPALLRALETVAASYKQHKVELFSGRAERPKNPSSYHPRGGAVDVNLYDPETGAKLDNFQDASSATAYQSYANEVYKWAQQNDPELAKKIRWGGYFGGGQWSRDWMHFDTGGADRTAGGNWNEGFDQNYVKQAGLQSAGGLGQVAQEMKAQGYTQEQILNALANIESRGSGDYNAQGVEVNRQGDKALGRYQVMASNVDPWAKQYLGREGVTTEQFMKDPKLQDELAGAVMMDYVNKYGVRGAYSKWFTGSEKEPERSDAHGKLTGRTYADLAVDQLARGNNAGGVANNYASTPPAGGSQVATASEPLAPLPKVEPKKKSFGEKFAAGLSNMGPVAATPTGITDTPKAALAAAQPTLTGNPEESEMRRQSLANIMARLNSGKLF
jgi:hypothetical protein